MAQSAAISAAAARNRRGRFTDRVFFHFLQLGMASGVPAVALVLLLGYFQPFVGLALPQLLLRLAIVGSLLTALTVATIWASSRQLARQFSRLSQAAIRIGDGDWDARVPMEGPVEVRTLAYRLNAFGKLMKSLFAAISEGSDKMALEASEQVNAATQASAHAATLSDDAIALDGSVIELAGLAAQTKAGLDLGRSDFIVYLGHQREEATRVNQVQHILSLIDGVAEQTRLLALNAAIEAERAGPTGRGLAAIAEDISRLAEDSTARSSEIRGVLEAVQAGRDVTGQALERASEQFTAALETMTKVATFSTGVRQTTAKQVADSQQVAEEMAKVTAGSQRIAAAASEMTAARLFRHQERRH